MERTITDAVRKVILDMPVGYRFRARDLRRLVSALNSKAENKYPDTIMRIARKVVRDKYVCVNMTSGLYERVA